MGTGFVMVENLFRGHPPGVASGLNPSTYGAAILIMGLPPRAG